MRRYSLVSRLLLTLDLMPVQAHHTTNSKRALKHGFRVPVMIGTSCQLLAFSVDKNRKRAGTGRMLS